MTDRDPREELLWESGWEGHQLAQRRRLSRLSLIEKLAWLEEAHRVVQQLEKRRAAKDGESTPP